MLKNYIISAISPETYYRKRFPTWSPIARPNVCCPWHDDSNPSLSIGLSGGGSRCFGCGKVLGNIVHFEAEAAHCTDDVASLRLYTEFIRPIVPAEKLASLQFNLTEDTRLQQVILKNTGIDRATIQRLGLGWDAESRRLAIPVHDRWGNVVNLRMYRMPCHRKAGDEKYKVINLKGFGGCDLMPWQLFAEYTLDKPVFVMPSEKEGILGIQGGLQCVWGTAGEHSWPDEWKDWFVGYNICIVQQRDDIGLQAATKKLASLQTVANYICIIEPPTKHKDFADYVVKDGGQAFHLLAIFTDKMKGFATVQTKTPVHESHPLNGSSDGPALPRLMTEEIVELVTIGRDPDRMNTVVMTTGIIAAKATNTYTIPWRFKIRIKRDPQKFYAVPMGRHLLSFIKASDFTIRERVREIIGNDKADVESDSFITAIEVEVIPTASVDKDVPYVTQRCFCIGTKIEANVPYQLSIIPTTDPRSQETIGIIVGAVPIARTVEAAVFSEEELASLQIFQRHESETVMDKMEAVVEELSRVHTKIFNRPDWHTVALLTWFSPIGWEFPFEKETQRGWLNSLAVGDSQTGKSKVTEIYQKLFNAGSIINSENCTLVGLVGGCIKMGSGQFMLRWGRIPLCDKQLVVVEELSGLSVDQISLMSDVRSSGIARLDKGGLSAETNCRTRILALSNVRPINRNLAGYLSGVKAIQELVGHGEDIARFDLIITLVDAEVSIDIINKPFSNRGVSSAIPDELWQRLCQFIWALKPKQIKITTDAYYACLDETKRLSAKYHPSVPVFKGGSGRYKIARIAAAIACLQFSWNGKHILVQEEHVEAAAQFLESLYDKPSFGYNEWSQQMFDRDGVKDKDVLDDKIKEILKSAKKRSAVVEALIHSAKFTRDELCAVASLQISAADDFIGVLVRERVLRKGDANVWEVTPAGKAWLITHLNDDPLS